MEILISITLLPLGFTDLRGTMDGRAACSDASMGGGGRVFLHGPNNAGITVSVP